MVYEGVDLFLKTPFPVRFEQPLSVSPAREDEKLFRLRGLLVELPRDLHEPFLVVPADDEQFLPREPVSVFDAAGCRVSAPNRIPFTSVPAGDSNETNRCRGVCPSVLLWRVVVRDDVGDSGESAPSSVPVDVESPREQPASAAVTTEPVTPCS